MARPVRAPELAGRGGWIGADHPLSLKALRGKVVLLHFWTFSCINCLRVLAELRPLEERFADELVIVGVHSPKFPREADHDAVVQAVARHRVTHPVLDDPDMVTWQQYGVRGGATLVLVDPKGYVVGSVSGEGCRPVLEQAIAALVAEHRAEGILRPGLADVSFTGPPAGPLAFPSKVAVSADGQRLAISDTGHDQVLVCSLDGLLLEAHTGFYEPHGVRFDGDSVLVCDTAADRIIRSTGEVVADAIASPWDLVADTDGSWVVAEAGRHRLVRVRPGEHTVRVAAGSGSEDLADGPAVKALLAQPSGVARTSGGIAFADAEASALRLLTDDGHVVTLVGHGLFEWGSSDGPGEVARLQHPLGVASTAHDGRVHVADTFNSLLRVWADGALRTLPVDGLDEPGGLDVLPDGRLVVADTNNHRVVVVDPDTGAVEPVEIDESWLFALDAEPLSASPGRAVSVPIAVDLRDEEIDRSVGAPIRVTVAARPSDLLGEGAGRWELTSPAGAVQVPAGRPGGGLLLVEVAASTCRDGVCGLRLERRRHRLEVS